MSSSCRWKLRHQNRVRTVRISVVFNYIPVVAGDGGGGGGGDGGVVVVISGGGVFVFLLYFDDAQQKVCLRVTVCTCASAP